jgi:hypothetical protein
MGISGWNFTRIFIRSSLNFINYQELYFVNTYRAYHPYCKVRPGINFNSTNFRMQLLPDWPITGTQPVTQMLRAKFGCASCSPRTSCKCSARSAQNNLGMFTFGPFCSVSQRNETLPVYSNNLPEDQLHCWNLHSVHMYKIGKFKFKCELQIRYLGVSI